MFKWVALGCFGLIVLFAIIIGVSVMGTYNKLVGLDQKVQSQWAQVENVYQRRSDLVPNLVETVRGAANFEKETLTSVTQARARVGQVTSGALQNVVNDPQAFARFQQAQDGLSSALSRLMVVSERYPELHATQNFTELQAQLEGTENRIAVERMRFNEVAQEFNTKRNSFPTVAVAGLFGNRFKEKAYFKAQEGANVAPKVNFSTTAPRPAPVEATR